MNSHRWINFGIIGIFSVLFVSACHSKNAEPKTDKGNDTPHLEQALEHAETAEAAEKSKHAETAQPSKPIGEDRQADKQNHYVSRPSVVIPFPQLNGVSVPPLSVTENAQHTVTTYIYSHDGFMKTYQQTLKDDGFVEVTNDVYLKSGEQPLIVKFSGGEGEYIIEMMTTLDPEDRYQGIPDKRIPYPLEDGALSAIFADVQMPNEASRETAYTYYNKSKSFISDYETRLKDLGFVNVRMPESPLYTKQPETNLELSVAIERLNEAGTDVRIKMTANALSM
ncbi:MAG: hypothetical protein J6S69_04575 [Proteobacteria bacterium]|nr:hypothetical protein [Pseudomonadota bacterium]